MIGREHETKIINDLLASSQSELLAVIGRRRVGKTYLVRETLSYNIDFELIGLKDASLTLQLQNFQMQIAKSFININFQNPVKNWLEAFDLLNQCIESLPKTKKTVLFFDEFPWLDSPKSGFKTAFSHFWNSIASHQKILIIICGSAASYMIDKVLNDKGGLHNRVTKYINLQPFSIKETESFLSQKGIHLNKYQILQLYMVFGGIPHYLNHIEKGLSAAQNIDKQCFQANGFLKNEFQNLYQALFQKAERHEELVELLSKKATGLTRQQLANQSSLSNGGALTKVLLELEQSGFIQAFNPYGKKNKDKIYRLVDYYTLFYFKFILPAKNSEAGYFMTLYTSQSFKTWTGYAFENICLQHTNQIKKALGIQGVYSENYTFYQTKKQDNEGAQIDLIIDRKDGVINLCEMKFYDSSYPFGAKDAEKIQRQKNVFKTATQTRKQIFSLWISTFGITNNKHSIGVVENDFTMDILFG